MNEPFRHLSPRRRAFPMTGWLVVAATIAIALSFHLLQIASAQADCAPRDASIHGWPKGSTVYYDVSALPGAARTQAVSAFNKWNSANGSNSSGVTFQASDATHSATFTAQVGSAGGRSAGTTIATNSATGIVTSASTTTVFRSRESSYRSCPSM